MKSIIKSIIECDYNEIAFVRKVNTRLDNSKIPFASIYDVLEIAILSACFMEAVISLCNGQSELYQTLKDAHSARAMMYIAVAIFIVQKVKLFNWQSVVALLLYYPIALRFRNIYIESPDLDAINLSVLKTYAIIILIVVDMIVYKKHNDSKAYRFGALILFLSMYVLIYKSLEDLYLIVPIVVLYFVAIERNKINKVIMSICLGWMGAAIFSIWESFVISPPTGSRWYGKFLNLGDFGQFLAGAIVANAYLCFYCYKRWKVRSFQFILSLFPIPFILIATYLSATRTLFAGIIMIAIALFVFGGKTNSKKKMAIKLSILLGSFLLVGGILFAWVEFVLSWDVSTYNNVNDYIYNLLEDKQRVFNWVNRTYGFYKLTLEDPALFDAPMFIQVINYFTSWRIEMWYKFLQASSFKGNGGVGIDIGGHLGFGNNAHNGFIQAIYQFGYIPGGLFDLCPVIGMIVSGLNYIKNRMNSSLFSMMWFALVVGIMFGESELLYFPLWVTMLICSYFLIIKNDYYETEKSFK